MRECEKRDMREMCKREKEEKVWDRDEREEDQGVR